MWASFNRNFFAPSAEIVAPRLLGHWLIRQTPEGPVGGVIVETEAYLKGDPASHGFSRETTRNRVMYGSPGHAYVYFIYGNHYCVNAVCERPGIAEAVLIRALEPTYGLDWIERRRRSRGRSDWTNGPGKLCQGLDIDGRLDGADLCDQESPLILVENRKILRVWQDQGPVGATTRVGITKAADLPLRFFLTRSPFVSRRPRDYVTLELGGIEAAKRDP